MFSGGGIIVVRLPNIPLVYFLGICTFKNLFLLYISQTVFFSSEPAVVLQMSCKCLSVRKWLAEQRGRDCLVTSGAHNWKPHRWKGSQRMTGIWARSHRSFALSTLQLKLPRSLGSPLMLKSEAVCSVSLSTAPFCSWPRQDAFPLTTPRYVQVTHLPSKDFLLSKACMSEQNCLVLPLVSE